jgi:hypothetical protein
VQAVANFAGVCADGDPDQLYNASLWLDECDSDAWRLAMTYVARLQRVRREIQQAFVPIWVEHKMLALTVGDRPVTAGALRVLMRGGYKEALTLYRGARAHERSRRIYGFSWTMDPAIARRFAEHWAQPALTDEGVLLRTAAPAEAILLIRESSPDYYDEGEVVVDPFKLGKVELLERLTGSY